MAEGGVEEMAKAYQTATEKMCELCLEEDSFKQATWYCKQCRQGLCDKCRKYHRKVASVKDHEVVRTEEMPPVVSQSIEELSDELRTPVCTTHKLPIELYCEDHNQPVCNSCKLVDHRKCKRLRDLEHVALENTGRSKDILHHLKSINNGLGKTEEAIDKENNAMEDRKEQIIQEIKNQIKEIETLGNNKIYEVERMFEKEQENLREEKDDIKQTQQLVSKSIAEIKTASQSGSEEELFIATNRAEKEAGKYQDILNDKSHVAHREVDFEVDSRLKCIASFGEIRLKKSKVDVGLQPRTAVFLNTKSSVPMFWFDVLPGEQVIALHHESPQPSHLSLYSRSSGLLSQLDLPGVSLSADTLNDHQIIVAIPFKHYIVTVDIVNDKLIQSYTIQTEGLPLLVLKYSEHSLLVLVQQTGGQLSFQNLNFRGNVQTHIPIATLVTPWFMKMNIDRDRIYITDKIKGCYGFNLIGNKLFHYNQSNIEKYAGLTVDHNNCVYLRVDDQEGKHLTKLSPTGQHLQRIGTDYGFPLRYDRNKLYLVKVNDQNERVITHIFA